MTKEIYPSKVLKLYISLNQFIRQQKYLIVLKRIEYKIKKLMLATK
jgi:hypothetical protein